MGRELTRRAVVRDGRSPPRFRRPYSARGDFGKISPFQGIGADPDPAGRRSLTAAQAANEFTRNCVLGFTGNWYFQMGGVIRGCAECFYGTLRTSIRVPLKVLGRTSTEIWREVRSFYIHERER